MEKVWRHLHLTPVSTVLGEGDSTVPMVPRGAPGFLKPLTGQALGYSAQRRDWEYGVLAGGQGEIRDYWSLGVLSDGVILGKDH